MIAGIGTREAVILNRLGVYYVAQIGLWRQHELTLFAQELQLSALRIIDERWVEQARVICDRSVLDLPSRAGSTSPDLPASFLRTITLLTCALLVGFFCVYLLGGRRSQLLPGVLSAEISSLKVPVDARLSKIQVRSGDEVFSGVPLLVLEKISHIAMIEEQQRRVRQLQQDLKQAEATSELEITWRIREVERELFDAQSMIESLQHVQQQIPVTPRTADGIDHSAVPRLATVSATQFSDRPLLQYGGLLFFSGPTGQFTHVPLEAGLPPLPLPMHSAPVLIAQAMPASITEPVATTITSLQNQSLQARLERLESLRAALPEQIRQAAGIEHLRLRHSEAVRLLEEMESVSREAVITAPSYGVVGQVRCREGDQLQAGEIMLKILHTDRRYVTVYVPSRRVHELHPGITVGLIFPGQKTYQGQVTDLPLLADTVTPGGDSLAAVRIEPSGRLWPQVPIGSQIDVTVSR